MINSCISTMLMTLIISTIVLFNIRVRTLRWRGGSTKTNYNPFIFFLIILFIITANHCYVYAPTGVVLRQPTQASEQLVAANTAGSAAVVSLAPAAVVVWL